jgi:hypothetical protein
MSTQETGRIKDMESKKKRRGPEFLLFPEFKVSRSFEPARLDLRAVVVQSHKMGVKITGGVGGVISAKLAAAAAAAQVPPL